MMEEFARMIYEKWAEENDNRDIFHKHGEELVEELEKILSFEFNRKLYDMFCDGCLEIEQNAFIAGFGYACKCLSNGKIELRAERYENG